QGAALHSADGFGGEPELAFAVFVEEAVLDELFEKLRMLGLLGVLHHLLEGSQGLLAVLHDELHHLVEAEELVLGGEFFAVEFAVEVLHGWGIVAGGGGEVCPKAKEDEDGDGGWKMATGRNSAPSFYPPSSIFVFVAEL